MIGNDQFLLVGKHTVLLLVSGNNNLNTLFKIRLCGKFPSVTDCTESRLIDNVGKFCTGSPNCSLGDLVKTDTVCNLDLLGMDFQDFLTSLQIRKLNRDPSVKTSRTKKCRIKGIRSVGSRQDHNTLGAVKTVHLCQKLVQCLLTLIVSTAHSRSVTFLTDGINLINKHNTWCFLIGLFKKISNLGSTHTNKHLHKFRTGNGEKRNLCLAGNSLGKKSFTGSRRAHKQGTFWHGSTDLFVFRRVMEEIHNLRQKLLGFILACHVCKFNSCGGLYINLGITFTKGHHASRATIAHGTHHLLAEPASQQNKNGNRKYISQDQGQKQGLPLRCSTLNAYTCIIKMGYKILIIYRYGLTIDIISIYFHRIVNVIRINGCLIYISSVYGFQKGGVIGFLYTSLRKGRKSKNIQQNNNYDRDDVIYIQRPLLWFLGIQIHAVSSVIL